jgi:hypothetical protein
MSLAQPGPVRLKRALPVWFILSMTLSASQALGGQANSGHTGRTGRLRTRISGWLLRLSKLRPTHVPSHGSLTAPSAKAPAAPRIIRMARDGDEALRWSPFEERTIYGKMADPLKVRDIIVSFMRHSGRTMAFRVVSVELRGPRSDSFFAKVEMIGEAKELGL